MCKKPNINDFNTFSTTHGEFVPSTSNQYRIVVNNMTTHGVIRNPLKYNHKFINNIGKGWGNVKSCLQSNGSLKKMKLFQIFDEMQGHESNNSQMLRELSGGPLALVSSVNPLILNPSILDPFGSIPHVPSAQPTPPIAPASLVPNYLFEENLDPFFVDSELCFEHEFALFL